MGEEFDRRMAEAARDMENQHVDESARTPACPAEVGYSVGSRARVSTSAKIAHHDVPYERLRNKHPDLESGDVEALLEHALGMSVYEAARAGYPPPDPDRMKWLVQASLDEVEDLLYEEDDEEEFDE